MELYAALYYYFAHRVAMYGVMAALGTALAVLYLRRAEKRFPETAADAELVFIYGLLGMFVGAKLLSLLTVLPELRADLPLLTSDIGAFSVSIYMRALSFMAACMVFCQPFGFMQSWQDVNLLYWQEPICRSCR